VVWAGVLVVVQAPAPLARPGPWPRPGTDHDMVLHQVSAWLSGLRQGVQSAPPLPAFHFAPPPARPEPRPEPEPQPDERPFPGFYL